MKRNLKKQWKIGVTFLLSLCVLWACQKEMFRETTTDEVNITGYLDLHPDTYSLLSEILVRSKTAGYLGAYGTYTLFAPDNNAIQAWIKSKGKNTIADFSDDELLNLVKYHVIRDTVGSTRFTDGKIKTPTLFGEFLYTDVSSQSFRINRSAHITRMNVLCGNGLVHGIDQVLTPPTQSLAEVIENDNRYSIFSQALKETGFYDTLYFERGMEVPVEKRFQTVIVESDSVLKTQGIQSFADLKAEYSHTGDPKNPKDSLWLYMAYHISNDGKFLEDIVAMSTIYTLAPKEIISTKRDGIRILLNEDEFNGVFEPGAELNRNKSDVMASNGVLHESLQSFKIKVRKQVPVYFDAATSPELKVALGGAFGVNGTKALVSNGQPIANSLGFEKLDVLTIESNAYDYWGTLETKRPRANGDILNLSVCSNNANRVKYVELKTPYLVKGRYKVWVCFLQNGNAPEVQAIFNPGKEDEQVLPNIIFFNQTLSASGVSDMGNANADNLMLAQGYKRYMATSGDYNANGVAGGIKPKTGNDAGLNVGRLAGTIEVETTDRHTIRFLAVGGKCSSNSMWLDMIQFIPADDLEQIYPRFHQIPGELFYRPQ
ncbi:fasciclin domain-containing protein [Sphingobacterium suaedae]|uniref:Fasciclin domain-containing protein n=1 Tax=Sphingobacterium suaedae TaxID=1686402 RepID=A0ABW5KG28_9SPHI